MSLWKDTGRDLLNYSRFILPIGLTAVLSTVLGVGWYAQPDRYARGYQPVQPIPYSHKLHAGLLRIPCLYCHTGALKSRIAGVPSVETCMNCHKVTKTESPYIKNLTAIYASGGALKWEAVHRLPDYVFFDHRPHVSAGILCQTCHGEVQAMDVLSQQMSLRMSNCLGCHRDPRYALPAGSKIQRGPEDCNACHR
ncbi:MAG: cytochrome c3 family protein [Bryobacteraceae bacterium]